MPRSPTRLGPWDYCSILDTSLRDCDALFWCKNVTNRNRLGQTCYGAQRLHPPCSSVGPPLVMSGHQIRIARRFPCRACTQIGVALDERGEAICRIVNGRWHRLPLHEFRDALGHRIATETGGALYATRCEIDHEEDCCTDCDRGNDDRDDGEKPLKLFKHGESSFVLVSFQFPEPAMDAQRTLECVRYQE